MINDTNKKFLVNGYRDIVKNEDGTYNLEPIYELDENNELKYTGRKANNDNELDKRCWRCVHHFGNDFNPDCLLRTKMDNLPENIHSRCSSVANCDGEDVVEPFCIIHSMDEMFNYIEKAQCMFVDLDSYEDYFGMKRKLDEEDEYAETVREYYEHGGKFKGIPDKYPVVIFFDLAMSGIDIYDHWGLEWIYIGNEV